ncbi:MAG TPA: TMEM175 family protein [Terriglobales bacterium]|nr:TMEM175 family protein [Terriglobales bacterium]
MNKSRLEAFSDGVFAIVITLLILDIHVPAQSSLTIQALRPLLPHIASFVLSFIIVGVYWVAHHHMLHFVRQVDRKLLWLNLLLLLCVVFIPFPASLLGTGFANPLVVQLYGGTLIATNLAGLFFWLYATSHRALVVSHLNRDFVRWVIKIHSSPMVVYALALGIAGWSTTISLVLFAAVPLFFILPNPFLERRMGAMTQADRAVGDET